MYTWLLSCSYTDCLSIFYETYGIGLCIFQNDQGNLHITFCFFCKLFILCHNIGKHCIINHKFLTSLLESYTKYFFVFQRSRYKVLIDLDYIIVSFFLLFQNLQSFFCVSRCDHTIGYLSLDQKCCIFITHIRKRNKITKRGHSVSTASSCISAC